MQVGTYSFEYVQAVSVIFRSTFTKEDALLFFVIDRYYESKDNNKGCIYFVYSFKALAENQRCLAASVTGRDQFGDPVFMLGVLFYLFFVSLCSTSSVYFIRYQILCQCDKSVLQNTERQMKCIFLLLVAYTSLA